MAIIVENLAFKMQRVGGGGGGGHHTSICEGNGYPVHTKTLPAIIPVKFKTTTLKAYVDTGSGRNVISLEAIKRFLLSPARHENRQKVTLEHRNKNNFCLVLSQP